MRSVIRTSFAVLLGIASTAACCAQQPRVRIKGEPDLMLMRSLPGVYMVRCVGKGIVSVPKSVEINVAGLDGEYEKAVAAGNIPAEVSRSEFKWQRLRVEPQAYLTASREMLSGEEETESWGTAFAISREGILLTNRHVVQDKPKPLDAFAVDSYRPEPFVVMTQSLIEQLGPLPSDEETRAVTLLCLLGWYGLNSVQQGSLERAELLLSFSKQDHKTDAAKLAVSSALGQFGMDVREAAKAPVKVLAVGGDMEHEDVAILQLDASATDALVCLPLAADDEAKQGMVVCSLGFPDWRYHFEGMHPLELLQVNESRGVIQLLPHSEKSERLSDRLKARVREITDSPAEELILVSAKMWHGVSGGPLVAENGRVVGLNVSGNEIELPEKLQARTILSGEKNHLVNNFAVPIAEAHKLLAANHIVPDPGPTTKLWNEGLQLYRVGRYAEAGGKFREVAEKQKIAFGGAVGRVKKPYESQTTPAIERNVINEYVQEMIDLAFTKATVGNR